MMGHHGILKGKELGYIASFEELGHILFLNIRTYRTHCVLLGARTHCIVKVRTKNALCTFRS